AVGQALETDTALAATPQKTVTVGLALETDTALNASHPLVQPLDQSKYLNPLSLSLGMRQIPFPVPQVTYAERTGQPGQALETDTALAATAARTVTVGLALETDAALDADASKPETQSLDQSRYVNPLALAM